MKSRIVYLALAAIVLSSAFSFAADPGKKNMRRIAVLERNIAELTEQIEFIDIEVNRVQALSCLEIHKTRDRNLNMSKIPGCFPSQLSDSVPHLKTLYQAVEQAREDRLDIMKRDREYEGLSEKGKRARLMKDDALKKEVDLGFSELYKRLRENEPEYAPANDRYTKRSKEHQYAAALYLIDHYNYDLRLPFPLEVFDKVIQQEVSNLSAVNELHQRRRILTQLRSENMTALERLRYSPNTKKDKKGGRPYTFY